MSDLVFKATVEVLIKPPKEDADWFREQDGPTQALVLKSAADRLNSAIKKASRADELQIKVDIMEVPEWEN